MKLINKFTSLALAAAMGVTTVVGLIPATAHAVGAKVTVVLQKTEVGVGDTVVINKKG